MRTSSLVLNIFFGVFIVVAGVLCAAEKIIVSEDPSKASVVFIVELSPKKTVRISEKIKTSKRVTWRVVEEKVNLMSDLYKKVLVETGKEARLLVCVFEYQEKEFSTLIYNHFPIHGNHVLLPSGKIISISKLK